MNAPLPSPLFDRRQFLIGSAALAAPLILPSRLFGADAPSNHIRLAAIGCGSRAEGVVLHAFADLPDVRIVAACDCFVERREAFANQLNEKYGSKVCEPVADFREVIARPDIDGVIVCTTDHWHVPIAYAAALAGKDAYVEKPLSPSLGWSFKLREAATRKKTVFQYGTMQRGDMPQFRRACEVVRNGYIGKIKEVICWCPDLSSQLSCPPYGSVEAVEPPAGFDYDMWLGPAPKKPYTVDRCRPTGGYHIYDYSIGFISGWGAHVLDIAQWGLNTDDTSPVRYEGTGLLPPKGKLWNTLESFDVRCEYASGVRLRLLGHRAATPILERMGIRFHDHGTRFIGENGWIQVDRYGIIASDRRFQSPDFRVGANEIRLTDTESHARDFVDAMRSRGTTLCSLECAIRSDTISHLGDVTIRLDRPVRWDPSAEKVVNDPEAEAMLNRPLRAEYDLFAS